MNEQRKPAGKLHTAGRLMGYVMRDYKFRFFLVLACIFVNAIATVAGSMFLKVLIDQYIVPLMAMDTPDFSGLFHTLLMMGCLYALGIVCGLAYNLIMVTISQGVQKEIRESV